MQVLADDDAFSGASRRSALSRWGGWAARGAGVLLVGGGGLAAALVILLRFVEQSLYSPWLVLALALFIGTVVLAMRLRDVGLPPRVRALPLRWRLALPNPALPSVPEPAQVLPQEDFITAPLSGRPCVAYEIGLREDDDSEGADGTWLLLEQAVGAFRIKGFDVPRGAARVRVGPRTLFDARTAQDCARKQRFLRERGFTGHSVRLFETVLTVDTRLTGATEDGVLVVQRAS